jgi:hypothetical protein
VPQVHGFTGGGDGLLKLAGLPLRVGEGGRQGGEAVLVGVGVAGGQPARQVDGFTGGGDGLLVLAGLPLRVGEGGQRVGEAVLVGVGVAGDQPVRQVDGFAGGGDRLLVLAGLQLRVGEGGQRVGAVCLRGGEGDPGVGDRDRGVQERTAAAACARTLPAGYAAASTRHRLQASIARPTNRRRPATAAAVAAARPARRPAHLWRRAPEHSAGEPTTRNWQHRWVVKMHKVRQWYPSEQRHKVIYRGPYIKGPDGKPLLGGETVRALVR